MSSSQNASTTAIRISLDNHTVPESPTNAPYVLSEVEAKQSLYRFPSKPRLVARSNPDVWLRSIGPEAYLGPRSRGEKYRRASP